MPSVADQELTTWVKTYAKEMLSWTFRRTSDLAASEDLVQETFLAAAEQIASFRRESHPRTWLFGILNNKIAQFHRNKTKTRMSPLDSEDPVLETFSDEGSWNPQSRPAAWIGDDAPLLDNTLFVRVFEECLAELPQEWHTCLTAKFIQNRSAEEICQDLGLSTTNYWQVIHRAKLKMRACLQRHWFAKDV